MAVVLVEIDDANIDAVLSVRLAPGQGRFVTTVQQSLDEAVAWSRANPWYRAVYVDGLPVGFVMADVPIPPMPSMSTEMKIFGGRWAVAVAGRSVARTRTAER